MAQSADKESTSSIHEVTKCYHCGDECRGEIIKSEEKIFCCEGCKLVYEILQENNLCNYYSLNNTPGSPDLKKGRKSKYDFLEQAKVKEQLISFTDGVTTNVVFFIPHIHCSSCIWLLENLYKLNKGVSRSTVNFLKREINIIYNEQEVSLKEIAELLDSLGYAPYISMESLDGKKSTVSNKKVYYKLGVAFFCFGNIMLLSFPEYFGLSDVFENDFRNLFGILNIILSLPVLLYADTDFFRSAIAGLRQRTLNIDFPISLGMLVMYGRSLYEILSGTGSGYMDTFAGLIFFMLSGRLFQNKTYERLSFERDYKSYFPVSIAVIENGREISKAVSELKKGDRIIIRNEELIPADAVLIKGEGSIDYSFVTGENIPVTKKSGDKIYAGGIQNGTNIELEVIQEVSQSRLTQLWNENNYHDPIEKNVSTLVDKVSKIFTVAILLIATGAALYYVGANEMAKAVNAFTAILIITCPCALALSYPFTLGNSIRILGNKKLYLKNTQVIEKLSGIDTIVFDKTGTLTRAGDSTISFEGMPLSEEENGMISSITCNSTHPLSRMLSIYLRAFRKYQVTEFNEYPGRGIEGIINDVWVKIGSATFTGVERTTENSLLNQSRVFVTINNELKGYFKVNSVYREGLGDIIKKLEKHYELYLISGDNDSDRQSLSKYFGRSNQLFFHQSPSDKLQFIQNLQNKGKKVMMIGDGLNDAGALKKSNAGIAISDNVNNFSPACDGILDASAFTHLPEYLKFSKRSMKIIYVSYFISFLYNCFGIYFAIQGNLSPLFAAIVMPLSTVTIILFTTLSSNLVARLQGLFRS